MIHEEQTDRLIAFLNELLAIDPECISILMRSRVTCNEAMANHATVQVQETKLLPPPHPANRYALSVLGLLNGFCGVFDDGPSRSRGPIAAVTEGDRILLFERTDRENAQAAKGGE